MPSPPALTDDRHGSSGGGLEDSDKQSGSLIGYKGSAKHDHRHSQRRLPRRLRNDRPIALMRADRFAAT